MTKPKGIEQLIKDNIVSFIMLIGIFFVSYYNIKDNTEDIDIIKKDYLKKEVFEVYKEGHKEALKQIYDKLRNI